MRSGMSPNTLLRTCSSIVRTLKTGRWESISPRRRCSGWTSAAGSDAVRTIIVTGERYCCASGR